MCGVRPGWKPRGRRSGQSHIPSKFVQSARTTFNITCIPMRGGFSYLVAVMDWASRFVLSRELDNTMEAGFCVSALEEALDCYCAPPDIEHGQGQSVHLRGVSSPAHRAAVAFAEVRVGLSGGSQRRSSRTACDCLMAGALQSLAPAPGVGGEDPHRSVFLGPEDEKHGGCGVKFSYNDGLQSPKNNP